MSVKLSPTDAMSAFDSLAQKLEKKGHVSPTEIQKLRESRENIRNAYNKAIACETSEPAKALELEKARDLEASLQKIESLNKFEGELIIIATRTLIDPSLDKAKKDKILNDLQLPN